MLNLTPREIKEDVISGLLYGEVYKMPVKITKVGSGKVRVSTPGGIKAKATSPDNAAKQRNLLNALDHGWKPKKQPRP